MANTQKSKSQTYGVILVVNWVIFPVKKVHPNDIQPHFKSVDEESILEKHIEKVGCDQQKAQFDEIIAYGLIQFFGTLIFIAQAENFLKEAYAIVINTWVY